MAINDKLNRIKEIKEDIKQALIDKGVEVTDEDSFASYANKITNIPMEGGDPYYEELYNLRTNNGTNMTGLFARMSGDSIDLTGLDTSQCTDMSYMFEQNKCNNIDCSGWDVSNVNKADYMFSSCSANINTTGWDTSNWSSLYYLFNFFKGGIDISNWNTGNITNVQYMFSYAKLTDIDGISALKLPKVTSYGNMFDSAECDTTLDLSNWNIDTVTNLSRLFFSTKIKRIDLSNWNTKNVTNMERAFNFSYSSITEELIIPDWDMTNTTNYSSLFGSSNYVQKLRYIDLSRSNDLTISRIASSLPARTETTYGDIAIPADSSQEVIDAIIAKYWRPVGPSFNIESFQITPELDEVLLNGKTKVVCHSQSPWYAQISETEFVSSDESIAKVNENGEVTAISLGNVEIYARLKDNPEVVSNTITISVVESYTNPYEIKFKAIPASGLSNSHCVDINNLSIKLKDMDYNTYTGVYTYDVKSPITQIRFGYNDHLNSKNISEIIKFDFNSNNITSMEQMFSYCDNITSLDLSNWNTSNVNNMSMLFYGCSSLKSLDLSNWDISGCVSLHDVFSGCKSLEYLDLSSWDTTTINGWSNLFFNVPSTCQIYVGPNCEWTEQNVGFTGTFIRVNPEYYTEYSIDSSTATFNMRSIDSINSGAYLPELSNGHDAVLLTLNDGSITTDLNTEANQVSSIKIYYPEETSYVKFANTKVKEVNHLSGANITDCTGMFTNCVYLEKADLTSLDSTKVTVDTTMFEGVNTEAEVTFNESWDIPESDMGRGEPENNYITGFDVDPTIDSFVFDKVDKRTLSLNIYPYEQGKQVSFSIFLEDSTLANSDTLYPSIDTYGYDMGYTDAIYCIVNLQIDDDLGTATLVIRETNSGIEKRISVSVAEPQPNVKVYYNRADGNYDNAQLAYNIPSEGVSGSTGFYNSDDNGQYASKRILKEREVELRVFNGYDPEDKSELVVASGTFTFTEDTTLWVVEGESTFRTEKPGTEEPDTPEEDGLVEMVFHINDFKNAFNSLEVTTSYDPHVYADYDLENASTDDYGKFITIKVKPNTNNEINLSSNCGYDSLGFSIDITNYSEIWFDTMNINLYTTPTRPNTITSLEGTYKLKINYYPHDLDISNGDYIRLDEGNYKRWINYKSSENNWYVYEEDVIANHAINFDAYGFYGEIPALTEDTEVWLISHNFDIYTTKPEVPNFTSFNTRVHLQKQGSDYSEGWHLCVYTGNNSNTYDIPQENADEFGLYFDIPDVLYTNIRHAFQFYSDAGDWLSIFDSKFTETHSELWMIEGDNTIYTEKPGTEEPELPGTARFYICDMCGKRCPAHEAILNHMICSSCGGTLLPLADKN